MHSFLSKMLAKLFINNRLIEEKKKLFNKLINNLINVV